MSAPDKNGWLPIATAPRDGRVILLTAFEDDGSQFETHPMKWSGGATNAMFAPGVLGMWVAPGDEYTWREGEGGPTHWRHATS